MKKIINIFLMCLVALTASAQSAQEVAKKAAAKYMSGGNIDASFTVSGALGNGSGTFRSAGKKFAFTSPGGSTWYNGKNMWTYNPSSKETTLVRPTNRELAESNPFNILSVMTTAYTAAFAKSQPSGCKVLVLRAKGKSAPFQKVVLTLNSSTMAPKKIEIKDNSGNSVVNITGYKQGGKVSASIFEYPKNQFPKVKVIDLR